MSEIRVEKYQMPAAELGSRNPLPDIKTVQYVHSTVKIGEHVTEEQRRYIGHGGVQTILPYQIQDGYNRTLQARSFNAVVLENETLRATFLPEHGGRLWSLYHKKENRELLHVNPVFQPCHLALRDAWFSGGVEWNVGIKGHTPYTCDPMHTEIVRVGDMQVLRMYEYERIRRCIYTIEAFLPEGASALYVKVHIKNTTDEEVPMYWWSNIAVDESQNLRVIVPADHAMECFYNDGHYDLDLIDTPYTPDGDISYPVTSHRAKDFFYDIPDQSNKWIAALDEDGKGLFEASTANLHGRKTFLWGMNAGGRHWQEFLSHGQGRYIEIQAGLAQTQLEHLPMQAGAEWSFVEAYGMISCDKNSIHGDWKGAQQAAAHAIEQTLGDLTPDRMAADELFSRISGLPGEVIQLGSGWGAVENIRREKAGEPPLSTVLSFPKESLGKEQEDWVSLLNTGAFPRHNVQDVPESYMAQAQYIPLLQHAGQDWYTLLQLGITCYAQGDAASARKAWEQSVKVQENGWALRNLAQLDRQDGNIQAAIDELSRAVQLLPNVWQLSYEYGSMLNDHEQAARFLLELEQMPIAVQEKPRLQFLKVQALCRTGNPLAAEKLLDGFVLPDIREGEISLAELWQEIQQVKQAQGLPQKELPYELDFRMH